VRLNVLYRGPLQSCNYACFYCPFAKRRDGPRQLEADRLALARFLDWIEANADLALGVLFTPWGEALTRPWYREALASLTRLEHVERAAAQTNGQWPLAWLERANLDRLALWVTYHPTEVPRARFVERCRALRAMGVAFSVGMVALPAHLPEIQRLRDELPDDVYLWLNAYREGGGRYDSTQLDRLQAIDPLFGFNVRRHASRGQACAAGELAIAVDGDGTIRRCHFVPEPIGHIDEPGWRGALRARTCPNGSCGCHIGYVHLQRLGLYPVFGEGLLERIPADWRSASRPSAAPSRLA
jgi:MoaA/NifB/PqqE/SkfB family radical SAM enzyme